MVRTSRIVAERCGSARSHEHGARDPATRDDLIRAGERELQVLRGERVGEGKRRLDPGRPDERQGRLRDRRPLCLEAANARGDGIEQRGLGRRGNERAVRAMLGLGGEIEREPFRIGEAIGDDEELARPRDRVDPDEAGELALRLGHVRVAWADDHLDGRDRRRPECQGGDRLRSAYGVDLLDAGQRTGGEGRGARTPARDRRRRNSDPRHACGASREAAHENG